MYILQMHTAEVYTKGRESVCVCVRERVWEREQMSFANVAAQFEGACVVCVLYARRASKRHTLQHTLQYTLRHTATHAATHSATHTAIHTATHTATYTQRTRGMRVSDTCFAHSIPDCLAGCAQGTAGATKCLLEGTLSCVRAVVGDLGITRGVPAVSATCSALTNSPFSCLAASLPSPASGTPPPDILPLLLFCVCTAAALDRGAGDDAVAVCVEGVCVCVCVCVFVVCLLCVCSVCVCDAGGVRACPCVSVCVCAWCGGMYGGRVYICTYSHQCIYIYHIYIYIYAHSIYTYLHEHICT